MQTEGLTWYPQQDMGQVQKPVKTQLKIFVWDIWPCHLQLWGFCAEWLQDAEGDVAVS